RKNLTLTIASLVTLLLSVLHITDDTIHVKEGIDQTGTIIILVIMFLFLFSITELAGRRLGYVMTLLGGLSAAWMPFLHTLGPRATRWGFFFVFVLITMGFVGAYTAVLSLQALWRSFRNTHLTP